MKSLKLSLTLKLLSALFSILGIVISLFIRNSFDDGWRSLLFFTLQSNLWMATMLIIFSIDEILKYKTGKSFINQYWYKAKYVFLTSVMLTFFVFGFLLLPFLPLSYTLSVTSISLHFAAPLLALADFLICDRHVTFKRGDIVLTLIPPLYYVIFVMVCVISNITFPPDNHTVPYFFLDFETYGWLSIKNGSIGVVYWFIIMTGLVLGIAFVLQKLIKRLATSSQRVKGATHGK